MTYLYDPSIDYEQYIYSMQMMLNPKQLKLFATEISGVWWLYKCCGHFTCLSFVCSMAHTEDNHVIKSAVFASSGKKRANLLGTTQ